MKNIQPLSSKEMMIEYIKKNKRVTFLELQSYIGNIIEPDTVPIRNRRGYKEVLKLQEHKYKTIGDYNIRMPDPYKNIILWPGVSLLFYSMINSILDKLVIYKCTREMYRDGGSLSLCPEMPLAHIVKEYNQPHWMPTIICPAETKLFRLKVEVKRLKVS